MIWLIGLAVVLLGVIAVKCIDIYNTLSGIHNRLINLSEIHHAVKQMGDSSKKMLEIMQDIERHTAMTAKNQYDIERAKHESGWLAFIRD